MSAINYYETRVAAFFCSPRDKILSCDIIFANKSQVSLRLRGSYNNTCNWPFYNNANLSSVIATPALVISPSAGQKLRKYVGTNNYNTLVKDIL